MNTISPYTTSPHSRVASHPVDEITPPVALPEAGEADSSTSNNGATTVSLLAGQLSAAAVRAEMRGGHTGADLLAPITDAKYFAHKAQHDAQIPTTDNPEHLARARQATAFLNGTDSNPFKGLARDQLSLIAHDDGGSFTINERRAAWQTLQSAEAPVSSSPEPEFANGRKIMISRLFGGREPPVALPPATAYNERQNRCEFLTLEDRAVIADMYGYAQAEGVDLHFVDRLITSYSTYRYYTDGSQMLGGNSGYDLDGHPVRYDFKPDDAATAAGILNGSAINSTRIDPGFLRYILNPDHGAFSNVGGIPFLERMVNKFSDEGADQPPLGSEFAVLNPIVIADHIVKTTNMSITLPPFNPVLVKTDDDWTVTEEGKAAGYVLDPATGRPYKREAPSTRQNEQYLISDTLSSQAPHRTLLDALAEPSDLPTPRWSLTGQLFTLLKNLKP
ncbi:hypothetical protein [Pseudomonas sp. TE24901]